VTYSAPIELAAWLGCLAFCVTLVNGVLRIADRFKPKEPVPPLHHEYATKVEANDHRLWDDGQHQILHERIDRVKRETIGKDAYAVAEERRKEDRDFIKSQLHELNLAVADLAGRFDERRPK
jgi:hypothetical protein